jgi:hypothetical protein
MGMPGYDSTAPARRFGAKVVNYLKNPANTGITAITLGAAIPNALGQLGDATASYGNDMKDSAYPATPAATPSATAATPAPATVPAAPTQLSPSDVTKLQADGTPPPAGIPDLVPAAVAPAAQPTSTPTVAAGANPNQAFLDARVSAADQAQPARSLAQANELQRESGGQVGTMRIQPSQGSPDNQVYGSASQPGGKVNNFVGVGARGTPAATGPTDAYGNLIVVPTSAGGDQSALMNARDAAANRGDFGAVQRSFNTPAQNDANDARATLTDRAMTGNLGAQRVLQEQMQGQNQLAVGQQTGQFGILGKQMELGSPLNQAHIGALGAQAKLYGAQQQEQEQKVSQQKQIMDLQAEGAALGTSRERKVQIAEMLHGLRGSGDLYTSAATLDAAGNPTALYNRVTGLTPEGKPFGVGNAASAQAQADAQRAVSSGKISKADANKRLIAAGLQPI